MMKDNKFLVMALVVLSNLLVGIIVYINVSPKDHEPSRYQSAYARIFSSEVHGKVRILESVKGSVFFSVDNGKKEYVLMDHYNTMKNKDIHIHSTIDKDSCSFLITVDNKEYNIEINNELYPIPNCK